jgi:hypothetical protein
VRFELLHALGCLGGLITQRRRLASLREVQEHEDREANDRGETGVCTHRGNEVVDREGERNKAHVLRGSLRGDPGAFASGAGAPVV